jgi:hypothetical protein
MGGMYESAQVIEAYLGSQEKAESQEVAPGGGHARV